MNWLDSASLSSLASSAFKTAQKKIDKILEIQDGEGTFVDESVGLQDPKTHLITESEVDCNMLSNPMVEMSSKLGDILASSLKSGENKLHKALSNNNLDQTNNEGLSHNNHLPYKAIILPKADDITESHNHNEDQILDNVDTIDACPSAFKNIIFSSADLTEKTDILEDLINTNDENVEPTTETKTDSGCENGKIEKHVPAELSVLQKTLSKEGYPTSPARKGKAFVLHSLSHSALFQDEAPSSAHPDLAFSVVNRIAEDKDALEVSRETVVELEEEKEEGGGISECEPSEDGKSRTPTNYSSDIEILSLPTTHPPSSLCSLCSDMPEEDYHNFFQPPRGICQPSKTQAHWTPPGKLGIYSEWHGPSLDLLFPHDTTYFNDVFKNFDGRNKGVVKYKLGPSGPIMNTMHPPLATHQKFGLGQSNSTEIALAGLVQSSVDIPNSQKDDILRHNRDVAEVLPSPLNKDADPATILKAREEQIMKLFQENMNLKEELTKKDKKLVLDKGTSEVQLEKEDLQRQIETLNDEFGRRIAETEKKLLSATRERDNLKKQLKKQDDDTASHAFIENQPVTNKADLKSSKKTLTFETAQLSKTLGEKEQIIKELMEEGNKLSKQQLGNSALIKKLRGREKELENNLASQNKKNEELMGEISKLKDTLSRKEALDRDQTDLLQEASADLILRADKITELESRLLETTEKCISMESALESAYKEIGTLHKALADKNNALEEAEKTLSDAIEKAVADARIQLGMADEEKRKSLYQEISDLQNELHQMTKTHKQREQNHRREIDDLRQGLKSSEARCQDLSQNISCATQPLVRQVGDLQQLLNAQKGSWEKLEQNFTQKLSEAEKSLKIAEEKETRTRSELEKEMVSSKSLQISVETLQQEREELLTSSKSTQNSLDKMNSEIESHKEEVERLRIKHESDLEELKAENQSLKEKIDSFKLKLEDQAKQLVDQKSPSMTLDHNKGYRKRERVKRYSRTDSYEHNNQSFDAGSLGEWESNVAKLERKDSLTKPCFFSNYEDDYSNAESSVRGEMLSRISPLSITPTNLSDSLPSMVPSPSATTIHSNNTGVPVLFEKLEFQLKLKEGELHQLQGEMHKLERSRESMAHELVNLTSRCDALTRVEAELQNLRVEHGELNKRYNTVLQMYGEKAEEADELRMDLQDLKVSYRNQMEILIPSPTPNKC